MKNLLAKAWNWLVTSSEDPSKFSARFLGLVTTFSGIIALAISGLGFPATEAQVIAYVAYLTQGGGIVYTIFGIIRYVSNLIDKRVPPTV